MTSMVFVDGDNGPSHEELFDAARGAAGRPGLFLERLRAAHVRGTGRPHRRRARVVAGVYAGSACGSSGLARREPRAARCARPGRAAGGARPACVGRPTADARVRRARGARRARTGGGVRRTTRLDRSRSRPERACGRRVRACERWTLRRWRHGLGAAVGIGVVWTDQRRFREAEASLRGACAAADLVRDTDLKVRATLALARCLYWQARYDEAAVELSTVATPSSSDGVTVEAWALLARVRAAMGDVRAALAAAGEASSRAGRLDFRGLRPRPFAAWPSCSDWSATRSRSALGRSHAAARGVRARAARWASARDVCSSSRCAAAGSPRSTAPARWLGHLRSALARRPLPALLRQELEKTLRRRGRPEIPRGSGEPVGPGAARARSLAGDGSRRS